MQGVTVYKLFTQKKVAAKLSYQEAPRDQRETFDGVAESSKGLEKLSVFDKEDATEGQEDDQKDGRVKEDDGGRLLGVTGGEDNC